MMHTGCTCTDRCHTITVEVKKARDINVGDALLTATTDEIDAFTGSAGEVVTMSLRHARTVTEARECNARIVLRHGSFYTNAARQARMLVLVMK